MGGKGNTKGTTTALLYIALSRIPQNSVFIQNSKSIRALPLTRANEALYPSPSHLNQFFAPQDLWCKSSVETPRGFQTNKAVEEAISPFTEQPMKRRCYEFDK